MKKLFFLSIITLVLSSCHFISGSGNIITQTRSTGDFQRFSTSSGIDVELTIGPVTQVVVEADDNVMKYIETTVNGDNLKIGLKDHVSLSNTHMKVFITAPQINGIKASSGSDVTVKDLLKNTGRLALNASSAGSITANIDAPEVEADASSGASIQLSGKTRDLNVTVSSGSDLKAGELSSENTVVNSSSGSSATVHASVSLNANASSGASIHYYGGGNVQKNVSSGGSVDKRD